MDGKYISEWISENFSSAEEIQHERMERDKEAKAAGSASRIAVVIRDFEDDVWDLYPDRTDILTMVNKFMQALYDEHVEYHHIPSPILPVL